MASYIAKAGQSIIPLITDASRPIAHLLMFCIISLTDGWFVTEARRAIAVFLVVSIVTLTHGWLNMAHGRCMQRLEDLIDIARVSSTLGPAANTTTTDLCSHLMNLPQLTEIPAVRIFCAQGTHEIAPLIEEAQDDCDHIRLIAHPWLSVGTSLASIALVRILAPFIRGDRWLEQMRFAGIALVRILAPFVPGIGWLKAMWLGCKGVFRILASYFMGEGLLDRMR